MNEPRTEAEEARRYHIDTGWFDQHNISFAEIARARMCASCQSKLGQEVEDRQPLFDRMSGRMTFEVRKRAYGSNPIKVIRECCSRQKHFIESEMPTLEAIFRVLLANANQPMSVQHIRDQLSEWCPGGGCQWLLLTDEQMERLIETDTTYGLREQPLPAAV
ncbi:MAG: hypothetical protein IT307_12920 [Chloroflexi bacterium]|nr:hypothetical protein [Chloroflexota bacterium]